MGLPPTEFFRDAVGSIPYNKEEVKEDQRQAWKPAPMILVQIDIFLNNKLYGLLYESVP
jgi:hypothetical protein